MIWETCVGFSKGKNVYETEMRAVIIDATCEQDGVTVPGLVCLNG